MFCYFLSNLKAGEKVNHTPYFKILWKNKKISKQLLIKNQLNVFGQEIGSEFKPRGTQEQDRFELCAPCFHN